MDIHGQPERATWKMQEARSRFRELFRRARTEGPQWVTRDDDSAVVVIPAEEYDRLTAGAEQPLSLVEFFRESPLFDSGIDLERTPDYGRKIDL